MEKLALITEASSKFSKELAIEFAKNGFNLFLVGQDSSTLKEDINESCLKLNVKRKVFNSDVSHSISEIAAKNFDVVVNNIDFELKNYTYSNNYEDDLKVMSEKFFTVCKLTKLLLPKMLQAKRGKILNIVPLIKGETFKVYRSALLSFSLALQNELSESGISVTFVSLKNKFESFYQPKEYAQLPNQQKYAKEICKIALKKSLQREYFLDASKLSNI